MLRLDQIFITHFKNYDIRQFSFTENVIAICGLNGKGKTNLLDAIYYSCFTKSYFSSTEMQNIGFTKEGFRLEANFVKENIGHKTVCIHRGVGKKEFSLNEVPYEKVSKHIGILPSVMIAPDDTEIIVGGSEGRRKYIDTLLCQLDADYLMHLMLYNKILQQRNALLKRFAEQGKSDESLLEILNQQITAPGMYIFAQRKKYTEELTGIVQSIYQRLSKGAENITVLYESKLNDASFEQLFAQNSQKDRILQRTNAGIHKDDLLFLLNDQIFKTTASQGQRKSLLFALKLAEFQLIKQYKGFSPILLLDDVFEKLDSERMQELLHWVCNENQGQVFITDTHKTRLEHALNELNIAHQIIELT